jgi:hypothetical protein
MEPQTEQEAQAQDQEVLRGYTATVRSVLQTKGKAPFDLAGLRIYETLEQIDASIDRCLEDHADPLLEEMQTLTQRRHLRDTQYQRVQRQQDWILGLEEILDAPRTRQGWWTQTGIEVAQEMEHFLDGLMEQKAYFPEDAAVIDHIVRRVEEWSPGLFNCYEEPIIPRTDNGLEQYIGALKRQRRRTTGHKGVADYISRHGPYAVFYDPEDLMEEILQRFRQVSSEEFREERERFRAAQSCQRRIRSFRRDSDAYLQALEHLWRGGDDL